MVYFNCITVQSQRCKKNDGFKRIRTACSSFRVAAEGRAIPRVKISQKEKEGKRKEKCFFHNTTLRFRKIKLQCSSTGRVPGQFLTHVRNSFSRTKIEQFYSSISFFFFTSYLYFAKHSRIGHLFLLLPTKIILTELSLILRSKRHK